MSRLLSNSLRSSHLYKPTHRRPWVVDKRAVAYTVWTGRSLLFRKPIEHNGPFTNRFNYNFNQNTTGGRRHYGMLVARVVRGVLKIRYLVLGGAVGGGMTLNKKYAEWKDGLPDLGWLNDVLPDPEKWDRFTTTLINAKDSIRDNLEIDARLKQLGGNAQFGELREWFVQRYEDAVAAAAASNSGRDSQSSAGDNQSKSSYKSSKGDNNHYESRVHALQEEVLALQSRYQRELQRLELENRELRQQNILLRQGRVVPPRKMKKSLIDMYSSVLDELSGWQGGGDRLPRVVVVGDQSAGKTSVLEMIAQARIFPRGAGEMMTRAPVKVTLSEGPYHVAQFRDSSREFDLTKESDLADLRKEVEMRMRNSVRGGRTVSTDVISMSVRGPGLHRMVLVDLPGVISTQTVDMAADTREAIKEMTRTYMDNPNAIILCIQDGSVDAERSNVTDLVSSCDPSGKRTIFVLTKVDLAEENLANPNRIRRILEGKLFPMKALGYYAVVTGRSRKDDSIQSIRDYEERFFRTSKLFKDGLVTPSQVTTRNLSLAVADCFWKMVRATVEQQADAFKAMRFNLETEWKNSFPRTRELDRDELFERARAELLDECAALAATPAAVWEQRLGDALWQLAAPRLMHQVYLPAAATAAGDQDKFNTLVDIALRSWADTELPSSAVHAGRGALAAEWAAAAHGGGEPLYAQLRAHAATAALERHVWEARAAEVLRVLQLNALQDRVVPTRQDWDRAVALMETALKEKMDETEKELRNLTGPGFRERWFHWSSPTPEQTQRSEVRSELERAAPESPTLTYEQLAAIRDNLRRKGVEVDNDYIRETWEPVYLKMFVQKALNRARDCKKSFYIYHQQAGNEQKECCEVVMFWRVQQTLRTTANALRQQITSREAGRLDKELREVLDELSLDQEKKTELLSGRRVELAEELKRVRQVQEKLEEFIEALNKEK